MIGTLIINSEEIENVNKIPDFYPISYKYEGCDTYIKAYCEEFTMALSEEEEYLPSEQLKDKFFNVIFPVKGDDECYEIWEIKDISKEKH